MSTLPSLGPEATGVIRAAYLVWCWSVVAAQEAPVRLSEGLLEAFCLERKGGAGMSSGGG